MRWERTLRTTGSESDLASGIEFWLKRGNFSGGERGLYRRGSRWFAWTSLRIENWPTELHVQLRNIGASDWLLTLRYDIRTGFHLVGALELLALRTEVSLLEKTLQDTRAPTLEEAMDPVRRPVYWAVNANMLLAVLVVLWVGRMGSFPIGAVLAVAVFVALLDGLVILTFADLLLQGLTGVTSRYGDGAPELKVPGSTGDA
ncbi:MAG TPA: hypothetical protein PKA37_01190 [Planctomycetota bacterium]|jgi:hypothetical protein|nr:hypothetical protein [Planctomycetota bacterium]